MVLHRPLYRGEVIWNQSRKRDKWGRQRQRARDASEWIRGAAPELRIVSEAQWSAVHGRLAGIRAHLQKVAGGRWGRRSRDVDSKYLLPGFARCGVCGGGMCALTRDHGKQRAFYYACLAHHKRGAAVCANGRIVRMEHVDRALLETLGGHVLRPAVVQAVIDGVFVAIWQNHQPSAIERPTKELHELEAQIARLTTAIAQGGELASLLEALKSRQTRRDELVTQIAALSVPMLTMSRRAVEKAVRARLADWRALLTTHVQDGRELLRRTLAGPMKFTPAEKGYLSVRGGSRDRPIA